MPTIITHGVVALAMAAKMRLREVNRKALLIACAACAMLPDIDYFGFKMNVQYSSLFGHRGFTHSLFFAALAALLTAWILQRRPGGNWRGFGRLALLLFVVTASHGVLDALTDGGEGVAFFSPFSNHRYFFPYRPIMVSPLGVEGFFNLHGLIVLLDEFLLVIVPLTLVLYWNEARRLARASKVIAGLLAALWILSLAALKPLYPLNNIAMTIGSGGRPLLDLYVKQYGDYRILEKIPTAGIPGGKLVTSFWDFQKRGLFNRRLEASDLAEHWASGFWAAWYGGVGGRWQDPAPVLLFRTLLGYGVPDAQETLAVLKESAHSPAKQEFLFRLSPAEKYDLAIGDYSFAATKSVLARTHNANELPKYWYGICNGMAAASKSFAEPFRAVDVINPNGFRIRFHPNDVKGLLGYAMAEASRWTEIGTFCTINGPEAEGCRINAGALFLATMNRIGLAHDGFVVDGFSGVRKQFFLFDAARVEVLRSPRPVEMFQDWTLPTQVRSLAEVRFHLEFVSTLLSEKAGGMPDESAKGEGYFKKVGRVIVPRVLDATLALDQDGNVIGGAWMGKNDVPDLIYFPSDRPGLVNGTQLKMNPAFSWPVINQIYSSSRSTALHPTPVDLSL